MTKHDAALVWLRRDLRCEDHAALHHALRSARRVHCAFVFDTEILDALADRCDRRVEFIRESLVELDQRLDALSRASGGEGSGVLVRHGRARDIIPALALELGVDAVHCNRDYEPDATRRDAEVADRLRTAGIALFDHKDQVIFDKGEILTRTGQPYGVFTPYRRNWEARLDALQMQAHPVACHAAALAPRPGSASMPSLTELGFEPTDLARLPLPTGMSGGETLLTDFLGRIDRYHEARDYPGVKGVSYLSTHLRFGTVSIRRLVREAVAAGGEGARTWLSELIWREFYQQLLWHHPHVVDRSYKPEFDAVVWADDEAGFAAWCEGRTGYPIVDAAMRQLNTTGYMHNRLRMVAASFLTKDIGVDWRRGEHYFARKLNDYDLAANNGGWQWAASTGCDAQPWFRIFNPVTQSKRFDADGRFILRYVPELARVPPRHLHAPWEMDDATQAAARCRIGSDYPRPVVDHGEARARTLARFEAIRTAP
ncbi:MAG: deoxyribodipyrimidine photo-lyase [Rhodocyclaceae bacterium]|nr:deoxyribodipyrimidine photo-lyase [Rhodocyclaceae bacterium]